MDRYLPLNLSTHLLNSWQWPNPNSAFWPIHLSFLTHYLLGCLLSVEIIINIVVFHHDKKKKKSELCLNLKWPQPVFFVRYKTFLPSPSYLWQRPRLVGSTPPTRRRRVKGTALLTRIGTGNASGASVCARAGFMDLTVNRRCVPMTALQIKAKAPAMW